MRSERLWSRLRTSTQPASQLVRSRSLSGHPIILSSRLHGRRHYTQADVIYRPHGRTGRSRRGSQRGVGSRFTSKHQTRGRRWRAHGRIGYSKLVPTGAAAEDEIDSLSTELGIKLADLRAADRRAAADRSRSTLWCLRRRVL
jgi:hypothetical protein